MQSQRLSDIQRFYDILGLLIDKGGGPRRFAECTIEMDWPLKGVYFIQQPGELRKETGEGHRIVRVGTNGLKKGSQATLWDRLKQHKGNINDGGGNHRSSIFRSLIGRALINRNGVSYHDWGRCNTGQLTVKAHEQPIEQAVSALIGEMSVICLSISDETGPNSLRGYIEENSIALLSNLGREKIDPPFPEWLGFDCERELVSGSGLWNSRHVKQDYHPDFLEVMEEIVDNAKRG